MSSSPPRPQEEPKSSNTTLSSKEVVKDVGTILGMCMARDEAQVLYIHMVVFAPLTLKHIYTFITP